MTIIMNCKSNRGRPKLPKGEKRGRLLSVKMKPGEWTLLERVALSVGTGVTPSALVRLLIAAEAERRGITEKE
jgi:hypothetical protein